MPVMYASVRMEGKFMEVVGVGEALFLLKLLSPVEGNSLSSGWGSDG